MAATSWELAENRPATISHSDPTACTALSSMYNAYAMQIGHSIWPSGSRPLRRSIWPRCRGARRWHRS
eukprot:9490157-Pyramimonas_sp.AAC.1